MRTSQVLTLAIAVVAVALLFWFLQRTRAGKAMRAYSDNEDLALLSGVEPDRVVLTTWVIAASLAAIAGTLFGLDKSFQPFTYMQLLLPMFAAAIVGGIGQPHGAIAGGFLVAFSEIAITYPYRKFLRYLLPEDLQPDGLVQLLSTDYKLSVSFVILVVVLLWRPTGLFRGRPPVSGGARAAGGFATIAAALLAVGFGQSWAVSLAILNLCLISAVMALGVNIQWGYAGLFNVGTMAFAALGGLAAVLVSESPVPAALAAGGADLLLAALAASATAGIVWLVYRKLPRGRLRSAGMVAAVVGGYFAIAAFFDPAVVAIEAVDPSTSGYLGGLGLPVIVSWAVGGLFAAAGAYVIGRIALGLRADYFAIATLGISEIVIAVLKNEDWLARGVKNVTGLDRPVPYEIDLQQAGWFHELCARSTRARSPPCPSPVRKRCCAS